MAHTSASWSALFSGRWAIYTLLLTLAVGVHATSTHLLATVLPSVVADIGGVAFYAWATMMYTIATIIGTACGGLITARFGPRRGYLAGVLVVMGGVAACAVAVHITVLLLGCAIQGLGCGLLVALAYGMVSELYPDELRPRALSAISGMWGLAALMGPALGGLFASLGWWRGAFWGEMVALLLLGGLAWYALPAVAVARAATRLPVLRLALLGVGVCCIALSGQVASFGTRVALMGSAGVLVGLMFHIDRRATNRVFPAQSLSLATPIGTAAWIFILFGLTISQVTVFMPLVVQRLYGVSPLAAGYCSALLSLAWTIMALGSASLQDRRVRTVIVLGPLVMLGGVTGLGVWVDAGSLLLPAVFMSLTGAGIGVCFAHISSWTIAAAQPGESMLTASSIPTLQSLGTAFGAAIAGLIANMAGLASGVSRATVASAATWIYGLSVIAPAILIGLALRFVWLHRVAPPEVSIPR